MLARHGYGVLLFDRRGEGVSDGDPNILGWQGERDIRPRSRSCRAAPTSIRERIGAIGLSVGGEMLIEAAAESDGLAAVVSEGAVDPFSPRAPGDPGDADEDRGSPGRTWL